MTASSKSQEDENASPPPMETGTDLGTCVS